MIAISDVFLSHRRSDAQPFTLAIREHLTSRGHFVFMDVSERRPGLFGDRLRKAIIGSNTFVLVVSPDLLQGREDQTDWVEIELLCAIQYQKPVVLVHFAQTEDRLPAKFEPVLSEANQLVYCNDSVDRFFELLCSTLPRSISSRFRRALISVLPQVAWFSFLVILLVSMTVLLKVERASVIEYRLEAQQFRSTVESAGGEIEELKKKIKNSIDVENEILELRKKIEEIDQMPIRGEVK